jgi:large conductance mechanosensitive channel
MIQEFREFILRGNVIDLAVGIVIGAAFGKIVSSFVGDLLMPPIGVLLGQVDFSSLSFILVDKTADKAAVVISYGKFINTIIDFLIIAFAVFLVIRQVNKLKGPVPEVVIDKKTCEFCCSSIPAKAVRCPACTSELKG